MSVPSGIAALDEVLGGGLPEGAVTLATGPIQPALDHLSRTFLLEGLGRLETGLVLEAREPIEALRSRLASVDPHLSNHESEGRLRYVDASRAGRAASTARPFTVLGDPFDLNGLAAAIEQARGELDPGTAQRIVVDSLDALLDATDPSPVARFLQVLFPRLERAGVTTLVLLASPERLGHARAPVQRYADVQVRFRQREGALEARVEAPAAQALTDWIPVPGADTTPADSPGEEPSSAVG